MMQVFTHVSESKQGGLWMKLDPRVRIVAVALLCLVVAWTPVIEKNKFICFSAILIIFAVSGRVTLKSMVYRLWLLLPLAGFLSLSIMVHPAGGFDDRALAAGALILKTSLIFLGISILAHSLTFHLLVLSLERFGFPRLFCDMLFLTNQHLFLIGQEARRMVIAIQSRQGNRSTIWNAGRNVAAILPAFFNRVVELSERKYVAMISRGYNGSIHSLTKLTMTKLDYWFLTGYILVLGSVVYLG